MSVLVTGGGGYIGSHMVWRLVDEGEDVIVLDNFVTGFEWAIAPEATVIVGDCGDHDLLARVFGEHEIDAVIHFAGSVVVPDSVTQPLAYYHNNAVKSHALITASVANGVSSFIFSSTAAVYGTPSVAMVDEDAPLNPESPYGRSKLMTEMMLADAGRAHDLNYVALRYFNVAGADPMGRTGQSTRGATHLIKVASETALGKREGMTVYGGDYPTPDGTCVRDYIHVSDLVEAHLAALGYLRQGGDSMIANCGYGRGYSVLEVVDAVKKVSGVDFAVSSGERRPGDPAMIVASPERIRSTLGWTPKYDDLFGIVRDALNWEENLGRRNQTD